jgi:hypothetical protein
MPGHPFVSRIDLTRWSNSWADGGDVMWLGDWAWRSDAPTYTFAFVSEFDDFCFNDLAGTFNLANRLTGWLLTGWLLTGWLLAGLLTGLLLLWGLPRCALLTTLCSLTEKIFEVIGHL